MATLKHNQDGVLIIQEPTFITEWEERPQQEIKFTAPAGTQVNIGDRIWAKMDLGTRGRNAGTPVDIYYIVEGGISQDNGIYTVTATRIEV